MAKAKVSLADIASAAAPALEVVSKGENNVTTLPRDNVTDGKRTPHTSLYLPRETKKHIQEIAFQFDKKPHDLYIEGINLMLAKYGKPPVRGSK